MGALKKITAWVLIGIFQVFLMHQALPHQHHTHDKSNEVAVEHQPQHPHHHHHEHHSESQHSHNVPAENDSNTSNHHQGLLGMLFGEHSHSNGFNHQHTLTPTTVQNQKVKEFWGFNLSNQIFSQSGYRVLLLPTNYAPPILSFYFYNPSLSHRGPPSTV